MRQRQRAGRNRLRFFARVAPGVAPEDDDIEQAVSHQTVSSVDATHDLARSKQVLHIRLAVRRDVQTAVLIVKRRIDQNRLRANINAMLGEHPQHRRNPFFNRSFAALDLDHWRIEPHGVSQRRSDAFFARGTFSDDGRCCNVARLERVHERLALGVNEHRADRADLFCHQRAIDLRRERRARGMVLQRIRI